MKKNIIISKQTSILFLATLFMYIVSFTCVYAQSITGTVIDKKTKETLPGAYITLVGLNQGTVTDMDGYFDLPIQKGKYSLLISYVSYESKKIENVIVDGAKPIVLNIELEEAGVNLQTVEVVVRQRTDTDLALNRNIKASLQVVSGISSQQISKTVDRDASEVVKRVPGVTIMGDRFVVIRGLNQRYNNVWLNNAATPSSEADSRAFSFDIIPSSLIDNLLVFKSPAPEIPADFSGGFIKVLTKIAPENHRLTVNVGTSYQHGTTFQSFVTNSRTGLDYMGLGANERQLPAIFPLFIERLTKTEKVPLTKAINQGWDNKSITAIPDLRFSAVYNTKFYIGNIASSNITSVNYSNTYKTHQAVNRSYGVYQMQIDKPSLSKDFNEEHYNNDSKFGILSNFSFTSNAKNRVEFRNFFNQIGKQRVVLREGREYSNNYTIQSMEMLYTSRSVYSTQLGGFHTFNGDNKKADWTMGYSYANRYEPDRKIITSRLNNVATSQYFGQYSTESNDIMRNFQSLHEHLGSLGGNFEYQPLMNTWKPTFKTGLYSELKSRSFNARNFVYEFNMMSGKLPANYKYLPIQEMFADHYIANDGVVLKENTNKSDSYTANSMITSAYVSANLPLGNLNMYVGVRAENNIQQLNGFESDGLKPVNVNESALDFFPSANLSYNVKDKNVFRLAFGQSINRPEFREIAPYVYYDFEAFSNFEGNPKLKDAHIQNLDFRYEYYPSPGETVSLSVFYKSFKNPIELTYFEVGGQYQYTYTNALAAQSVGAEIDIKKNLQFIGLNDFSVIMNGSIIKSDVVFAEGTVNRDRPMEGQSPYLMNAGVFYESDSFGLNASVLYNVIGKRITAIGVAAQNINEDIPDIYEMPRHMVDISIGKKVWKNGEIKLGIKDVLNTAVEYKQFPRYEKDGKLYQREQITRRYTPGTNVSVSLSFKL